MTLCAKAPTFICNFFYNKENLDILVIQNIDSYEQTASAINHVHSKQVVTIKNPQRIGTYSYTTNGGMPMTVPVIDGKTYK